MVQALIPKASIEKTYNSSNRYVLQTLHGIQGTKDAGYEWYQLLATIFTQVLKMVPSVSNKGLFYWSHNEQFADIALATDDMLMVSSNISLFHFLSETFKQFFDFITTTEQVIFF